VLRHDDVSVDAQSKAVSDALEGNFKDSLCGSIAERLTATVAGECYKVSLPGLLESLESRWHEVGMSLSHSSPQKA